ncbi:hypothetical protein AB0K51_13350 [Kitasatospora sp. NPDC049285]|uniref:hypothetical protein n=1 Tax=Kitasatospora sp. NPDC049285 TaxID=3157096 RepID=UPI003415095D
MDDIPQGGSGGVPLHHDDDEHDDADRLAQKDQPKTRTVLTVRASKPVAEQTSDPAPEPDEG